MYHALKSYAPGCRTPYCPHCHSTRFRKHGFFYRRDDARRVQRYRCSLCGRSFSRAGFTPFYRHRHRRLKERIRLSLATNGTIRGTARSLKVDKSTVSRYLVLLARQVRLRRQRNGHQLALAQRVQFDELITFEHTRMKPVSVMLITDTDRWRMLGCIVSRIPASGYLAEKSRKKYGYRADQSIVRRAVLMRRVAPRIDPQARIDTDSHSAYPPLIKRFLPDAKHVRHKSMKAAVVGQGELKTGGWDPLFCVNHQLAMLRANISRLFRRSWNTTKRITRLADHLTIYMDHYNRNLRPRSGRTFGADGVVINQ